MGQWINLACVWGVCVCAWPATLYYGMKEVSCYFLQMAPFFLSHTYQREEGSVLSLGTSPGTLLPLSPVSSKPPFPPSLSHLLCYLSAIIFSLYSSWPDLYLSGFVLLTFLHLTTRSLFLSLLCHSFCSFCVSRWTSPVWKNPSQWVNGKIAMATDTHIHTA